MIGASRLKLGDHVEPRFVVLGLRPGSVEDLLEQLLAPLAEAGEISDAEGMLEELVHRESLQSTGIGSGVAIPHCICDDLDAPRVIVGVCPGGTEYRALDDRPVHVFFLLVSPARDARTHVRLLAQIARLSRRRELLDRIRVAGGPDEVVRAVRERDEGPEGG